MVAKEAHASRSDSKRTAYHAANWDMDAQIHSADGGGLQYHHAAYGGCVWSCESRVSSGGMALCCKCPAHSGFLPASENRFGDAADWLATSDGRPNCARQADSVGNSDHAYR